MKNENLDELIKKYSTELIRMGNMQNPQGITVTDVPETASEGLFTPDEDIASGKKEAVSEAEAQGNITPSENAYEEAEAEDLPPEVIIDGQKATSFASFKAEVFTGEGAFPVSGAKIVVYRGDNIYAFLESDENGKTRLIRLPAFNKENSLDPASTKQSLGYLADVFSPGFVSQKGLTVSAVGGSDILLNVLLVPEEERMG